MKRILTITAISLVALSMAACQSSKKTVQSLKEAIDNETTVGAQYAAYAETATAEGFPEVTALFQANSEAVQLLAKQHSAILAQLGVDNYEAQIKEFARGTTAENLLTAMNAEQEQADVFYPRLLETISNENVSDAINSLDIIIGAKKGNASNFYTVSENINSGVAVPAAYFVCPNCGIVVMGNAPEVCIVCQTPGSEFLGFHAVMPLVEEAAVPVAEVEAEK